MKKRFAVILTCLALVGCTSEKYGPYALTDEQRKAEAIAATKVMCRIEQQDRCAHVIENRQLMARFFKVETQGGLEEEEKKRGRRITTNYVVEAVAAINQCTPVSEDSIPLLRDMKINGGTYIMMATKPVNESAACFITPDPEAS